MDKKTLAALIEGAEKWERNAALKPSKLDEAEIYSDSCELCRLFASDDCAGCPVKEKTGKRGCIGTPWENAEDALLGWDFWQDRKSAASFRRAAKAEAEFLRSLIPDGAA